MCMLQPLTFVLAKPSCTGQYQHTDDNNPTELLDTSELSVVCSYTPLLLGRFAHSKMRLAFSCCSSVTNSMIMGIYMKQGKQHLGKGRVKGKMAAMSFINDQGHPMGVADSCQICSRCDTHISVNKRGGTITTTTCSKCDTQRQQGRGNCSQNNRQWV